MPNGHGGVPFLALPIMLIVIFVTVVALPVGPRFGWAWVGVCLLLAALIGWRLAYDLHMRDADEYGGAYTPADVYRRAVLRYRSLVVIYVAVTAGLGFWILWWRGLPQP